jgi:hypothetical protein
MNSPEDQKPERSADCLLDCLTPREKRRVILGDEAIAQIHARVAEAPEPSDELVTRLRQL